MPFLLFTGSKWCDYDWWIWNGVNKCQFSHSQVVSGIIFIGGLRILLMEALLLYHSQWVSGLIVISGFRVVLMGILFLSHYRE